MVNHILIQDWLVISMFNEGYLNKLKNKIYNILCEREKNGDWENCLDSVLTELIGYKDKTINFYIIWYKLSACKFLTYKYFRKSILDVLSLINFVYEDK